MKWEQQSAKWRGDLDMSPGYKPWTGRESFVGYGLSGTKRALDLLDCGWVHAYKRAKFRHTQDAIASKLDQELFIDVSQNHVRKPLSNASGELRTLLTSTRLYHYGSDRLLLPVEHLALQGYSPEIVVPQELSAKDVRDMAGEAIALPCLATVMWCLHMVKDLTTLWCAGQITFNRR